MAERLQTVLAGTAMTWLLLLLVSPSWAPVTGDERMGAAAVTAAIVHRIGAQVCHQRPDRSFHLHGRPLAVCGRCTGVYASGAVGLLAGSLRRRRRREVDHARTPAREDAIARRHGAAGADHGAPRSGSQARAHRVTLDRRAGVLALAAAPTLLTWASEVVGLWNPGTPVRALAALPLGATAGWLIARALDG
jgi:hypothetical protein